MERYFLWASIALCAFALWAIARHDWLRLTRPMRRVIGTVTGHRTGYEDGHKTFAAIYAFCDETGAHDVVDPVFSAKPQPDVGTMRELAYPAGHPDLARPPRPLLWIAIYGFLLLAIGLLAARLAGWLS